jgi:tetratricopeptide (TPR) repeat protein
VLYVPAQLLWFKLPGARVTAGEEGDLAPEDGREDMNRREVLRLLSLSGSLLAVPSVDQLDHDRLAAAAERPASLDRVTIDEYERLNVRLWHTFSQSKSKRLTFPLVRGQLDALTNALRAPQSLAVHQRLCLLAGDLFQLCGEIFFDGDRYTDAASCYSLAANASKEAGAFDLWACAMTRHAFVAVYERQFAKALPLLDAAATLAQRGDPGLATRYWVAAVQAETSAGTRDFDACQRALDRAEEVAEVSGPVRTGGWLRFDGSRLAENRGMCYADLQRPVLAEPALTAALKSGLSARRRGGVLAGLMGVGVQRREPDQIVMYGNAALDAALQTGSAGYLGRKLNSLRPALKPFLADGHVRHLDQQIARLQAVGAG